MTFFSFTKSPKKRAEKPQSATPPPAPSAALSRSLSARASRTKNSNSTYYLPPAPPRRSIRPSQTLAAYASQNRMLQRRNSISGSSARLALGTSCEILFGGSGCARPRAYKGIGRSPLSSPRELSYAPPISKRLSANNPPAMAALDPADEIPAATSFPPGSASSSAPASSASSILSGTSSSTSASSTSESLAVDIYLKLHPHLQASPSPISTTPARRSASGYRSSGPAPCRLSAKGIPQISTTTVVRVVAKARTEEAAPASSGRGVAQGGKRRGLWGMRGAKGAVVAAR